MPTVPQSALPPQQPTNPSVEGPAPSPSTLLMAAAEVHAQGRLRKKGKA